MQLLENFDWGKRAFTLPRTVITQKVPHSTEKGQLFSLSYYRGRLVTRDEIRISHGIILSHLLYGIVILPFQYKWWNKVNPKLNPILLSLSHVPSELIGLVWLGNKLSRDQLFHPQYGIKITLQSLDKLSYDFIPTKYEIN